MIQPQTEYVPKVLPPKITTTQPIKRPWNIDPSCVLCLMPEVNTKWIDYSGKGNDGTITSATKTYGNRFGEGLLFDGLNDFVNCGNNASLNITTMITVEAWVKIPDVDADGRDISSKYTIVTTGFILHFDAAHNFRFYSGGVGAGNAVISTTAAVNNVWYHVVGVHDGTDTKIYINGIWEADAVTPLAPAAVATDLIIGARTDGASKWIKGYIDEFRIYNRALAPWEIKALYEQGRPGGI